MRRIIVYGLGKRFQRLADSLNWSEVVALCDQNATSFDASKYSCPVIMPSQICDFSFDYVVMTPARNIANEISSYLQQEYRILEERIIEIDEYLQPTFFPTLTLFSVCKKHGIESFYDKYRFLAKKNILTDTDVRFEGKRDVLWTGKKDSHAVLSLGITEETKQEEYFKSLETLGKKYRQIIILCSWKMGEDKWLLENSQINENYDIYYYALSEREGVAILEVKQEELFLADEEKRSQKVDSSSEIKIYVITHKDYKKPQASIYETLRVGNQPSKDIDHLNAKINECTGLYWMWKYSNVDIIGLNHYRRFFEGDDIEGLISREEIKTYLGEYDICVARALKSGTRNSLLLKMPMDEGAFQIAYRLLEEELKTHQPEYLENFYEVMEQYEAFFLCNMFITRKEIMDEYCQWLFSFLIPAAERFDDTLYDSYSRRAIGFFAERMLTVWLMKQNYRIKELPITQVEL